MKYDEVRTMMDDKEAIKLVLQTGRDPKDMFKNIIDKIDEIKFWNRCHTEYGTLQNVERVDYEATGTYSVKVTYDTGKMQKDGSTFKTGRFKFQNNGSPLFENLNNAIGRRCKFYVSYACGVGDKEGDAFRQILDWQVFGNAPTNVPMNNMTNNMGAQPQQTNPVNANFQFN